MVAGWRHLALSALGDAFLAHEGDAAFLGGLGSFLAAHILYAVLFIVSVGDGLPMRHRSRPAGCGRLSHLSASVS
jgi:uncharacterized membrane protein YhhN